ncbi:uncharacterized protein LOC124165054 [Ischnura elegans]|uniref:uncharacterized protein LOC124165054 n=1 Tax=Ischnura elegans TaxID=197161 RepID=UPI001ED8B2E9|nr:uncharacterized protein LOC124165054 [Ischnura elegans]
MMEYGFSKADSGNLSVIDSIMTAKYFRETDDFVGAESRCGKMERSGRVSYGDSAVGYVQVKRCGNICFVRARVTPEHKVRSKCYIVVVEVDEEISIINNAKCLDCKAAKGGCKHVVAVLMWLHRRSEEPAPTSTVCYWRKSRLSSVVDGERCITAKEIGSKRDAPASVDAASETTFLNAVLAEREKLCPNSILMKHFNCTDDVDNLSLHLLRHKFFADGGGKFSDFIDFCNCVMTEDACSKAATLTVSQSKCSLWEKLRYSRITASKIYDVANCKTMNGSLVETLLGGSVFASDAMKRGVRLEPEVIREVERRLKVRVARVGLLLSPTFPILGASPDGLMDHAVVEVKSPSSSKTFKSYVSDSGVIAPKFMGVKLYGGEAGMQRRQGLDPPLATPLAAGSQNLGLKEGC